AYGANQYGTGINSPGLFGGQGYTPNNSTFSLKSVLAILGNFFGIGNGSGTPYSFLSSTTASNPNEKIHIGISFFADRDCTNGITTLPAGQTNRYYSAACTAFSNHRVSAIGLNGQCQPLKEFQKFED